MIVFILVCALFGGVIGFGAAMISDKVSEKVSESSAEISPEEALEEALKAAFHIIGIHLDINLQRDRDIIYGCFQRWKQIRKTQL